MILALVVLAGCSSEQVAAPPPVPANWQSLEAHPVFDAGTNFVSEKERALAGAYTSALTSPGFTQLSPLLDDEVHMGSPGMDDGHGRKDVMKGHEVLFGAFDDRKVTMSRVWRTADEQSIEWTMTGTLARDWMGIPATHREAVFNGLTLLWTKDDGTVTDVHVYVDIALVKAQMGVGPKDLVPPQPAMPTGPVQIFERPQGGAPNDKGNAAVAQAWFDDLEDLKESAFVDAVANDVDIFTLEKAKPIHGKEEIRAYYKAMHRAIGQLDTTVLNSWGVAQFAVVEYTLAGEQLAPIDWIPAQRDRVIRFEIVDVFEITAGKISRVWRYDNPAEIWSPPLLQHTPQTSPTRSQ
jgi:SnoaL-like domain/SnoaL-like polyketide cyclase